VSALVYKKCTVITARAHNAGQMTISAGSKSRLGHFRMDKIVVKLEAGDAFAVAHAILLWDEPTYDVAAPPIKRGAVFVRWFDDVVRPSADYGGPGTRLGFRTLRLMDIGDRYAWSLVDLNSVQDHCYINGEYSYGGLARDTGLYFLNEGVAPNFKR
jgi:hypothetical protein